MFGTYRTLLAFMVVGQHLGGVPVIGSYAVFGFYVLSGYLMTLIMHERYAYGGIGLCRYLLNRFLRIYPSYWVSSLVSVCLILAVGEPFSVAYHKAMALPLEPVSIIRNIIIFFPGLETPRLTPPSWALTVELFFYILIGLGLSRCLKVTILWVVLSFVYHLVALCWGGDRYFSVFAASLPFATGALIYHCKDMGRKVFKRVCPPNVFDWLPVLLVGLIGINCIIRVVNWRPEALLFYVNYVLCSVAVLLLADQNRLLCVSKKLDRFFGEFSYPVYLLHYQVGIFVIACSELFGYTPKRGNPKVLLLSIPILLMASYAMILSIDRPIERIRKKVKTAKAG